VIVAVARAFLHRQRDELADVTRRWCHGGEDGYPTFPLMWLATTYGRGEAMGHVDPYLHLLEACDGKSIGRAILLAAALFGSSGPANAITAEVAKKCRELAIQAHPPQPAGTIPYAEAERAYFKECVNSTGSLEGAPPTYRDVNAPERGTTALRSEKHALAQRRHHSKSHDRLTLWGRNPAYPLLSAAGYGDHIVMVTKATQWPSAAYRVWSFRYHRLANRKLAHTHHAAASLTGRHLASIAYSETLLLGQ
jgi:hypothetical protein